MTATAVAICASLVLPAATSQADEPKICTLIGCESGVTVDLRPYRADHSYIRRVVVCVERRCEKRRWKADEPGVEFVQVRVKGDRERTVKVKVVMYDGRGRKRFRKVGSAFLRRNQPNGPECEPVCFVASMKVSLHGRLRQTSPG
jgi:hypothetical protein